MLSRPSIPVNTQRRLWAESIGHCMNSECQTNLFQDNDCIGELAHINPNSEGGDVSFENLIPLCCNCHTLIDKQRTPSTLATLQHWKTNRKRQILERFTKRYSSFSGLANAVIPILDRNRQIFDDYGPAIDGNSPERYKLWLKFEGELIANNQQLEKILLANRRLLHQESKQIVDELVAHTREFIETRDTDDISRVKLFPKDLNSVFGLEQYPEGGFAPSVAALQNFISWLLAQGRCPELELAPDQFITYTHNERTKKLSLKDRYRFQQLFWNGRFYRPQTTELRLETLVFFVQWLYDRKIQYLFPDVRNLTKMVVGENCNVLLCYKYILSLTDLQRMPLSKETIVVNLHNWNGAPSTKDAVDYATQIDVRLFTQNQFFVFAHHNFL